MPVDPIHLPVLAEAKDEENWDFRQFLKFRCRLPSDQLDARVAEITRRVWAGIDCTACANCCKKVRPTLSEAEVDRLAGLAGLPRQQFIEAHLEATEPGDDNPWRIRSVPCLFLKDNRCSIYEDRPEDCRGYPYLEKPDFVFRVIGMIGRTATCPIVYDVMEELKTSLRYRPKRR